MILAGTSKGVFQISEDGHQCTLDRDGIREVVVIRERLFAGSGQGVYTSDDSGTNWTLRRLQDQAV